MKIPLQPPKRTIFFCYIYIFYVFYQPVDFSWYDHLNLIKETLCKMLVFHWCTRSSAGFLHFTSVKHCTKHAALVDSREIFSFWIGFQLRFLTYFLIDCHRDVHISLPLYALYKCLSIWGSANNHAHGVLLHKCSLLDRAQMQSTAAAHKL